MQRVLCDWSDAVIGGKWSNFCVLGVYTSKAKAEEVKKAFDLCDTDGIWDYSYTDIEEHTLNYDAWKDWN